MSNQPIGPGGRPVYPMQPPPVGAPQGYPQPGFGQPAPIPMPKAKKSPIVGVIAAAIVGVAAALGNVVMFALVVPFRDALASGRSAKDSEWIASQFTQSQLDLLGLEFKASLALGFVAFVIGIIAIATNRGRGWGVTALILSIIGPFITLFVFAAVVMAGN
jgi:hypothetical protein